MNRRRRRWAQAIWMLPLAGALMGCAGDFKTFPSVESGDVVKIPIGSLSGTVYGGQSPIWQSHVYLMKATTTGYGQPSKSMLVSAANTTADTTVVGTPANPAYYVTTDSSGNFDITGDYTCNYNATTPTQSDQLYLLSLSGNATFMPGPSGGSTNPLIGLMSVLGQCPSDGTFAGHLKYIIMNEISTVAAAYALAGFASNSYTVSSGSSTQAMLGLANAFANANQIYDIQNLSNGSTHEARTTTPNGNGTVPQALVDTVGNILASCINLTGATSLAPTNGNCFKLNSNTGSPGSGYNITSAPGGYTVATEGEVNNGTTGFTFTYTTSSATTLYAGEWVNVAGNTSPSLGFNNYGVVLAAGLTTTSFSVFVPYNQNANLGNGTANISPTAVTGVSAIVGTDTASAAIYIAQHPGSNVAALYALQAPPVQFADDLGAQPNDFSLAIAYTGGGLSSNFFLAIDGSGNIWSPALGSNALVQFSPLGVPLSGTGGFTGGGISTPYGLGIDTSGNVWIANFGANSISEFNSSGAAVRGTAITGNGLNKPYTLAFDSSGNFWVPDYGSNAVSRFTAAGAAVSSYTGSGLSSPRGVALSSSTVYLSNENTSGPLSEFNASTGAALNTGVSGGGLAGGDSLDLDASGNVWVVSNSKNALAKFPASGAALSPSGGYTGGGLNSPIFLAVDGAGNVFAGNSSGNSISEFNNAGTAITNTSGYVGVTSSGGASLNNPLGMGIDSSGNLWVSSYSANKLVEFVGIAAPVVTPKSSAVVQGKLGSKP